MEHCLESSCDKPKDRRGYCRKHYVARLTSGEFGTPKCSTPSCTTGITAKGLCSKHYQIQRRRDAGMPLRSRNPSAWRLNAKGYRHRRVPNEDDLGWSYEFEHRTVIEQKLGRKLLRDEEVHHKNGDRADNRIENLELWSTKQPKGQRVEDKVEFALEILRLYFPESVLQGHESAFLVSRNHPLD